MKAAIDLHIHSALSPCADNDMTPNNIANMAFLKGLDIIAITDHNSVENFPAVEKCAQKLGILAIPGMELETREEVHLVCLFPDVPAAFKFQELVYEALPHISNREDIFGEQLIMDDVDEVRGHLGQMLLTAADIGFEEAVKLVQKLGGIAIPAHIDRDANSVISNLGIIPDIHNLHTLELSRNGSLEQLSSVYPYLRCYDFVTSSDAHHLWDILEREVFLELSEKTAEALIHALGEK